MSSTLMRTLIGALLAAFFAVFSIISWQEGQILLSLLGLGLSLLSLVVWLKKDFLSYRFLYPGLLCFLIFTILPILFSVAISFTNLGTGHFYSKDKVKNLLLKEKFVKQPAVALPFRLVSKDDFFILHTPMYQAQIPKRIAERTSLPLKPKYNEIEGEPLTIKKVFSLASLLKKVTFITPKGERLIYHRTDLLIEGSYIYENLGKNQGLENTLTGQIFTPNDETGYFTSQKGGKTLSPGFTTFVGLKNYKDLFLKKDFRGAFLRVSGWTFLWALISVFLSFSVGMSLAILLNDKSLKFKALYRNLLILPYSIPFFISVLVFKGMLNKDFGVINEFLASLSISPIPWLEDGLWAKISCLLVNLWLGFPYMFLITTGILQSIPASVYEAAKIDGANRLQTFKSITFPMILNSVTPLLIGAFAFNLGNFVGIYLLTGGGPAVEDTTTPAGATDILISYTYRLAFEGASGQRFGLASSIALFIFLIIGFLTFLNFKVFNSKTSEGGSHD